MSQDTFRHEWTYADYARLPDDGNHYEVIDGELLTTPGASPKHQHVTGNLYVALRRYVEREGIGVVLVDVDLLFVTGQYLRPDLLFVPNPARDGITNAGVEKTPGLVVEVQSPTSGAIDRVKKPRRYGDFGVPEYWVVDPDERVVWVWRFARGTDQPERLAEQVTWSPPGASEPFTMTVEALLSPM